VGTDEFFAYGQPETAPSQDLIALDLDKLIKDLGLIFEWNAGSIVLD
jgi:hypothetical protein